MKTYISGQITGLPLADAEDNFLFAEQYLNNMGMQPVNPMKILPYDPKHEWQDYMVADIKELFTCEAIFMLSNWTHSKGARIERAIAVELGLHITYQPKY
jgi:hypothetical protein